MACVSAEGARLPCYIGSLPDSILAKVFAYLPHKDRLHLSEICSRWRDVTRLEWLDVIDLDLTPIPSPNIGAVLRLCPNVESIFAFRRFLILNDLTEHYQTNLTSIKLYDVKMGLAATTGDERHTNEYRNLLRFVRCDDPNIRSEAEFGGIFHYDLHHSPNERQAIDVFIAKLNQWFEKLPQLEELVLHNLSVTDLTQLPVSAIMPFSIQTAQLDTLTRLQLTGSGSRDLVYAHLLSESLRKLRQLQCLILHLHLLVDADDYEVDGRANREFSDAISSLQNLRELSLHVSFRYGECIGARYYEFTDEVASMLPRLEVLFLLNGACSPETFVKLYTTHPSLRVLLLVVDDVSVGDDDVLVPARKVHPNATSGPLPFLHVFVCRPDIDSLRFRFATPTFAEAVCFDRPTHEFLGRHEIAEILNGVWVAEMLQETASYDPHVYGFVHALR